jgi:hypothetical protein
MLTTYVLLSLVFNIYASIKWLKLANHQTMGALQLLYIFEAVPVHFKADGSAPHGIH